MAQKRRVTSAYEQAKEAGLWPGCYAMTNEAEFFAELSMWYFGSHGDMGKISPRPASGKEWLERYDGKSYQLFDRLYRGERQVGAEPHVMLAPERLPVREAERSATAVGKTLSARGGGRPCSIVFDNRTDQHFTLSWCVTIHVGALFWVSS